MKYTKYIALFSVLFFAACTTELIEPSCNLNGSGVVQLASRVVPFSDRDVTTRANKNEAENKISSIDYLIFGAEDKCIFHQRVSSIDPLLVDKSDPIFKDVVLSNCYIVSIANGPELNVERGVTTWDLISSQSIDVSGVSINSGKLKENGLPMVGRYPETGTFNFGGTNQGTVLTIPMKSLFSKIVFKISVDAEEIRPGENQPLPTFTLTECTVHNLASSVDFIGGTESAEGLANGTNDVTAVRDREFSVGAVGETADGRDPLTFSFYLPERFLRAGTSSADFTYPFNRDEEQGYRQHYKPLLAKGYKAYNSTYDATKDKKATFARLKGVYSNHQGHLYDVSYDIYVGNDNYGNFDIVRNTQYNNTVIIKGINNSSSQSPDLGSVSIDHRVNVERSAPIIINLRRETLLDSHFEVRPLLIRKNMGYGAIPDNAKVKVEVVYNDGELPNGTTITNWIGLERSFGNGVIQNNSNTYLVDSELSAGRKNATGKRKYFTTDLTTNTLNSPGVFDDNGLSEAGGTTVIVPITDADQRVWIYIDECSAMGDGVRTATIRVSWDLGNGLGYSNSLEYVINQRLLFPVTYSDHPYNIEYHEEYLYNYDSDDKYGQTEYEGMKWGLDGLQLSTRNVSFHSNTFGENWVSDLQDFVIGQQKPYYDFYNNDTEASAAGGTSHPRNGYQFTEWIVEEANIGVLNLAQSPASAVEYCYNKNKRNAEGQVVWQTEDGKWITDNFKWYLPAIDEIEEIVKSDCGDSEKTYIRFIEFQNKYYWSSQPSYEKYNWTFSLTGWFNSGSGSMYSDDLDRARATKINYLGNDEYSDPISSGVDHAIKNYHYEGYRDTKPEITNTSYAGNPGYHEGNFLRTRYNRVRCVRKQ